jgi:hypothetical protein
MASKDKPDVGDEAEQKTTAMDTADLDDSWAAVQLGKTLVYVYPFNDTKTVSLSYMVTDLVEVGIDLGLNSNKVDKPKDESTDNTFGAFITAYPALGKQTLEATLAIDQTATKSETAPVDATGAETDGDPVKKEETAMEIKLGANILVPLSANLMYAGGLTYTSTAYEEKEAKDKKTFGELAVNLASLRLTLN